MIFNIFFTEPSVRVYQVYILPIYERLQCQRSKYKKYLITKCESIDFDQVSHFDLAGIKVD